MMGRPSRKIPSQTQTRFEYTGHISTHMASSGGRARWMVAGLIPRRSNMPENQASCMMPIAVTALKAMSVELAVMFVPVKLACAASC